MFLPVAQYLRRSTEHQQYSLENQSDVIAAFAATNEFSIVKTYTDGRSGLVIDNRNGLKSLLHDVTSGNPGFKAVLVYDVSRWGRFLDCDESAHYEFLCRSAGIPVLYCAEQFPNDGSLTSYIFKTLKRVMAAEYSRDLGKRVFHGQERLAKEGFWMGGASGYGYRRALVATDPKRNHVLEKGECKVMSTDRVVLIPGPPEEVCIIGEIFRLALTMGSTRIANQLNASGSLHNGLRWSKWLVDQILKNPKYTGSNVRGRTSVQLRQKQRRIPRDQWICKPNAFPPLVPLELFNQVQQKRKERRQVSLTDAQVLQALKRVAQAQGKITQDILLHHCKFRGHRWAEHRFGSLKHIHDLLGITPPSNRFARTAVRKKTESQTRSVYLTLLGLFPDNLTPLSLPRRKVRRLRSDTGVSITIRPCISLSSIGKERRWRLITLPNDPSEFSLLCLFDRKNARIERFVITRTPNIGIHFVRDTSRFLKSGRELQDLRDFYPSLAELQASKTRERHGILVGWKAIAKFLKCSVTSAKLLNAQGMPIAYEGVNVIALEKELRHWDGHIRGRVHVGRQQQTPPH